MNDSEMRSRSKFIGGEEAHLYLITPEELNSKTARLRALEILNIEERGRYERFLVDHAKIEFLAGRVLLRRVLAAYLETDPRELEFAFSENDKPELAGKHARKLYFNLSHTRGLIALGIHASCAIGVDVETIEVDRAESGIARRFFSAHEFEWLSQFSGADYIENFFRIWTLKESYIKAKGMGMKLPLKDFHFVLNAEESSKIEIGFSPKLADDARSWKFHSMKPTPNHWFAVAIEQSFPESPTAFVFGESPDVMLT